MAVIFVNYTQSFQANGLPLYSASDLEVDTGPEAIQISPVNYQAAHAAESTPNPSFLPAPTAEAVVVGPGPDTEMVPTALGLKASPGAYASEAVTDLEANQPAPANKPRWHLVKTFLKEDVPPFVKKLVKWLIDILARML
ncbi:hypothetical protein CPB83DRAFT_862928 [Crepidotus variabilis]|uniref:Uncharacterized protein n=1 Tax=Crepidotus variabilis TaxID=179855 RepID=A0A9P6E6F1_9AGAR|nr:hypothetical protein CPB83DRAFT_862928 [Crepidotus variabilis]